MFINNSLMKTNYLLEKGMDTSLIRHQVISDNIANVDTPHFKRMEVTFESQMARALASEDEAREPVYLTNKKHIDFFKPMDYKAVQPKIHIEYNTNYRNDKNNVDIEKEISNSVKNSLQYKALSTRLNQNFKMLALSMQG